MESLFEAAERLSSILNLSKFAKEADQLAESAIQDAVSKLSTDIFKEEFGNVEILTDQKGEKYMTRNGVRIDPEGSATDMRNGDLKGSIEKLGFKTTDIQHFDKYATEWKATVESLPNFQQDRIYDQNSKTASQMTKQIGEPQDAEDMVKRVSQDDNINNNFKTNMKELADEITKAKNEGKKTIEVGKWVKRTIELATFAGTVFGALEFYKAIKDHQNALNGCWVQKMTADSSTSLIQQKCKLGDSTTYSGSQYLTCDKNAATGAGVYPICIPGGTIPANNCYPNCQTGATGSPSVNCFLANTCVEFGDNDPNNCCKTELDNAGGTNPQKCVPSTDGSAYSIYCSCDRIQCPFGYNLLGVNASFWDAYQDMVRNPFNFGNILNTIIRIVIYIVIGLVILLAIYLVIRYIFQWINESTKYHRK